MSAPWRTSLIIGNPENRRVLMWQAAVRNSGRRDSIVVSYADLLQGLVDLPPLLRESDVIRLDSPGENVDVERQLILRGAQCAGREDVCPKALEAALADRGRIVHPGLWAAGYRDLLAGLQGLRSHRGREGEAPAEPSSVCHDELCSRDDRQRAPIGAPSPRPSPPHRSRAGRRAECGGEGEDQGAHDISLVHPPSQDPSSAEPRRPRRWLSDPGEVGLLFDKPACQRRLQAAGVSVPRALPPVGGYEQLREVLREAGCSRVFVKLPGGSSASGVVALNISSRRISAVTSVELASAAEGVQLYNSLRVRRYDDESHVATLIDALAADGPLHVEEWVPKASLDGRTFDLRIVVIAGEPQHVVVRTSRGPLTNLHLGNRRGDLANLRRAVPEATWQEVLQTCRRIAVLFPGCLMLGVDLGMAPGVRKHFVIEVNAFGDLLPGVLHKGRDTYAAQVAAIG